MSGPTQGVFVEGRAQNINLSHNPDKPLAVDVPILKITQDEVIRGIKAGMQQQDPVTTHSNWWKQADTLGGHAHSTTIIQVELSIYKTGEKLRMPAETGTTCTELANTLSFKTGVDPTEIAFIAKQGCSYRRMYESDQVRPKMTVNGLPSFKKVPLKYNNPKLIIGAGHVGLKTAMIMLKKGDPDFLVVDRMSRVGGTSWMYQANTTSKLQTEYGAYHLEWDEDNPIPTMFNTPWPSRNKLLEHFESVCTEYGVMPYVKLNVNVKTMDVIDIGGGVTKQFAPNKWNQVSKYRLTLENIGKAQLHHGKFVPKAMRDEDDSEFDACAIMFYPGNLTVPREETYKGEQLFKGPIGYGMFDEVDYSQAPGLNACIVGHGAFAVENVRTCCEYGIHKCFLVCRRKNIACPRVSSWMANRSLTALTCGYFLDCMKPMYDLLNWDPWTYYAVSCNEKRTTCMIQQKARFGIGDIYFLSQYMGKMEVVVEPGGIKRVTEDTIVLDSGRKLEEIGLILKLLGFIGELENDRLMKIKELVGFWVNEDPRRYLVAEPVSVMASNMGGTSLSPGAMNWAKMGIYIINHPQDFINGVVAMGMLPRHTMDLGDEGTPRPAYVVDARHGTQTGMAIGMHTPHLGEDQAFDGLTKAIKHRLCHPVKKFIAAAKEDWDYYAEKFLKEGFGTDKPYPTYPYTVQSAREWIFGHMKMVGEGMLGPLDEEDLFG